MAVFDLEYSIGLLPMVVASLDATLLMTSAGLVIALGLGLLLAWVKVTRPLGLQYVADVYISFFRGTPLLVQLFLFYYGLPQLFPALTDMAAMVAVIIGLGLHYAAYMAESMVLAIRSVCPGKMKTALNPGMTRTKDIRCILLPQAAKLAFPGLMDNTVDLLKSTSLAFTIGVVEVMATAQMKASSSLRFFESYLVVALIYWLLVIFFSWLRKRAESRLGREST